MTERRIFGPPGTGKTTALTNELAQLARTHNPNKIVVLSFTKAAATNIASRALTVPDKQVGTLHAHCFRALDGKRDVVDMKRKKFRDAWTKDHPRLPMSAPGDVDSNNRGDQLLNELMMMRATMRPREAWSPRVREFDEIWESFKAEHSAIDFQDMIDIVYRDFSQLPGEPEVMVIDESQDFSKSENALIDKLGKNMQLVIKAGDDDQTIYEFKGADPSGFIDGEYEKVVLSLSYRIPSAVHQVAEQWIHQVRNRAEKEYHPRSEEGEVRRIANTYNQPVLLLRDAEKYLEDGKSVMFLTSCDYMLFPLLKELRDEAIAFHNPYAIDRPNGWNPLVSKEGVKCGADRLLDFLKLDNEVWDEDADMWRPFTLASWVSTIKTEGLLKRGAKAHIERLAEDPETAMREMSVNDLLHLFEEEALSKAMRGDLDWFEQHILPSKEKMMRYPLYVAKKKGARHLRETPQIMVGTIHSVKGGEADVVYLMPDLSPKGGEAYRRSFDSRDATIRAFYVGMTRARESLILCNGVTRRDRVGWVSA